MSIKKRLSRRLLSDVVEAILGAAALVSFDTAMQVGDHLGLCFGGITPWSDRPSGKSVLANLSQAAGPAFRKIEEAFGYRFEYARLCSLAILCGRCFPAGVEDSS